MSAEEQIFSPPPAPEKRDWTPMLIGFGVVAAIIIALVAMSLSNHKKAESNAVDPYASKLMLSNLNISQADVPAGGTFSYFDFDAQNTGDRTVVGATVEATFFNAQNQPIQTERFAVQAFQKNPLGGYPDIFPLAQAPLKPGETKTLRVTVDKIDPAWNQQTPHLQILTLELK